MALVLLLHRAGIEAVVLEQRSRAYVEGRVRAGVLEPATVDLSALVAAIDAALAATPDRAEPLASASPAPKGVARRPPRRPGRSPG